MGHSASPSLDGRGKGEGGIHPLPNLPHQGGGDSTGGQYMPSDKPIRLTPPEVSIKNVLITGRPGVGKTTAVIKIISQLDLKPGGFYTEELRTEGERKGFKIKTFSGQEGILAHVDYREGPRVGKYGVDVRSFETIALPEVEEAVRAGKLVVIDEIGKMELFSARFKELVIKALDSPVPLLGVMKEKGNGFIDKIKGRKDVRLFTLTRENMDSTISEILGVLRTLK
jgi:nucleoside-triphosphatase